MNSSKIEKRLKTKYPNSSIFENQNAEGKVIEVLCEVEPTSEHPNYSKAIAVIDKSKPHYHKKNKGKV